MSTFFTQLVIAQRWASIDRRLGYRVVPGESQVAAKLKARDAARSRYLRELKPCMPFTALPLELQLSIVEWLSYEDLQCLALTSRAMLKLVETPTPILDQAAFRGKALSGNELKEWRTEGSSRVGLHPALGQDVLRQVLLESNFETAACASSDFGILEPVQRYRLSRMKELSDSCTSPALSAVTMTVWDAHAEQVFLERGWNYNTELGSEYREDFQDVVIKIENDERQPVTVEQLLEAFFGST